MLILFILLDCTSERWWFAWRAAHPLRCGDARLTQRVFYLHPHHTTTLVLFITGIILAHLDSMNVKTNLDF